MRIISGFARGTNLISDDTNSLLRPTLDRFKESLFSSLGDIFKGKIVVDLYAGVGNLGLEALSRGAKEVYFIERHFTTKKALEENVKRVLKGKNNQEDILVKVFSFTVASFLEKKLLEGKNIDIVFADPPYGDSCKEAKELLKNKNFLSFAKNSLLILEHSNEMNLFDKDYLWNLKEVKNFRKTLFSYWEN